MKIIATDFDGTFNYGGIDDQKKNAVKRWCSSNNLFGIVSGRVWYQLTEIVKSNGFDCDFLIASNGAVILKPDGEIMYESRCDGSLAKPLLDFLFSLGCTWIHIHTEFECFINTVDSERTENEFALKDIPTIPYFTQITTMLPDFDTAEKVTNALKEKFGNEFNPMQNGRCIDIVSKNVNKANGIYKFIELIGAKYDDVITVGDNNNDADMIKEFRSYAMENGVDEIKNIANHTTVGITELIEKELVLNP